MTPSPALLLLKVEPTTAASATLAAVPSGDDSITGTFDGSESGNFGIQNDTDSSINIGAGSDEITGAGPDAFSGFTGGGTINLGDGDDIIRGFGEQTVLGGSGFDTAEFEFALDMSITLGTTTPPGTNIDISTTINGFEATMSFTDVEEFVFENGTFSLEELQMMA